MAGGPVCRKYRCGMTIQNAVSGARKPGFLQFYLGVDGTSQGWLEDYDGKWVYLSLDNFRTLGRDGSGASIQQEWTFPLFEVLWNAYSDSTCPVLTPSGNPIGRGATASVDWLAYRRITLPDFRGRTLISAGTGTGGLTNRVKGTIVGAETHTLTVNQIPSHTHNDRALNSSTGSSTGYAAISGSLANVLPGYAAGGGQAHNNMQPSWAEHLIVSAGSR